MSNANEEFLSSFRISEGKIVGPINKATRERITLGLRKLELIVKGNHRI